MTQTSFEQLVQASVAQAFCKTLGKEVWKTVRLYFDPKSMAKDPESFAKVLDKLFGGTSKVLMQVIGQTLITRVNGETDGRKDRQFSEWIQIAKAKFLSSPRLTV